MTPHARLLPILVIVLAACTNVLPEGLEDRLAAERAREAEERAARRELWVLETTRGSIQIRLFPDDAPATVAQVRAWTRDGVYDGTWFHRIVRAPRPFVIQGGDPGSATVEPATSPATRLAQAAAFGVGTVEPPLEPEVSSRKHSVGAVALAVSADGRRAGPQFVIALDILPHLDGLEPVFGQVEGGWSVIERLTPGDRIIRARLVVPERLPGEWMRDLPPAPAKP